MLPPLHPLCKLLPRTLICRLNSDPDCLAQKSLIELVLRAGRGGAAQAREHLGSWRAARPLRAPRPPTPTHTRPCFGVLELFVCLVCVQGAHVGQAEALRAPASAGAAAP